MNNQLLWLSPLIVSSDDTDGSAVPGHVPEIPRPDGSIELSAAIDDADSDVEPTLSAMVKSLCGVRDSPNGFGPLKSLAEDLCLILKNCKVWPPPVHSTCNAHGHPSKRR